MTVNIKYWLFAHRKDETVTNVVEVHMKCESASSEFMGPQTAIECVDTGFLIPTAFIKEMEIKQI